MAAMIVVIVDEIGRCFEIVVSLVYVSNLSHFAIIGNVARSPEVLYAC